MFLPALSDKFKSAVILYLAYITANFSCVVVTFLKRIIILLLGAIGIIVLLVVMWAIWERNRDLLGALPEVSDAVQSVHGGQTFTSAGRVYQRLKLLLERQDTIRATISFPPDSEQKKLPVVIILGGVEIGAALFELIPDPGENILIAYQFSRSLTGWESMAGIGGVLETREAILSVPAQVVELLRWTKGQAWTDTSRTAILGYSFGALFQPAVHHLAQENNLTTGPSVLAYGGADLELLFRQNLNLKPTYLRPSIAWLAATAIYPIEPARHAPHMNGIFYLINGLQDRQIPEASWKELHRLVPEPKTIDLLDEGHMHPQKPELTLRLVRMSRDWLEKEGVINRF